MPDRVQDLTNHRKVATACKNYTDQEIAKSEERMKWYVGEYTTSTSDDNTTASTKTVPSNATRCKIKRIYGLTQKFNPTTASDSNAYYVKTMPATVYDFDVSKVEGKSEVSGNNKGNSEWISGDYNATTGEYETASNYVCNNNFYCPVKANTTYTYSSNPTRPLYIHFYASDKSYLGHTQQVNSGATFTTPNNCAYIRYNTTNEQTSTSNLVMINEGATALPYEEYKGGYDGIHNLELSGVKVEGANKWEIGYEHYSVNTSGVLTPNNNWNVSKLISIAPNTKYTISGNTNRYWHFFYYDRYMNFISYTDTSSLATKTITTPNNAYYMYSQLGDTYSNVMLNIGESAMDYKSYVSQTLPIDLTSIEDSGGNKLFADGKLREDDYITPYKASKGRKLKVCDSDTEITQSQADSGNGIGARIVLTDNALKNSTIISTLSSLSQITYNSFYTGENVGYSVHNTNDNNVIYIRLGAGYDTTQKVKDYLVNNNTTFEYKLATPIEVSINWASTLRGITGYSNGTITLQNTYNMDTANLITYNSIIKENCCAKVVQSRGGDVVATVNFPTQASDGWSAGSANNYRDFTTNKRTGNVSKSDDMSDYFYDFVESNNRNIFRTNGFDVKAQTSTLTTINALSRIYNATTQQATWVNYDMAYHDDVGNKRIAFVNNNYKDTTTFKTAMANEPLYYENNKTDEQKTTDITPLDTNILVVESGDTLAFFDSNDNPVTVPSDLTYRIEVAN